jgi:putative oxidoreductase
LKIRTPENFADWASNSVQKRELTGQTTVFCLIQTKGSLSMTRAVDSGVILIARIALAVMFVWAGAMKLLGYTGFVAYLQSKGVPFVAIAAPVVVAIELLGGLLLVVGFRIRALGLILAIYTVATAIVGHDFWNVTDAALQRDMVVHFWKNVAIAGGFLLLTVTGAGRISIDGARAPRGGLSL